MTTSRKFEEFQGMCAGTAPQWCLRAKIDMASDNGISGSGHLSRERPASQDGTKYRPIRPMI